MTNTNLDKLSKEQFQQLYPILLFEHNPKWFDKYEKEKNLIESLLQDDIAHINHYGSTSVPGLLSKPSIDILLEIKKSSDRDKIIGLMKKIGYSYINKSYCSETTIMFFKGYELCGYGENIFHVHLRYEDDWDELYFRDFLRSNPDLVKEYSELKLKIVNLYLNNRKKYTAAKTDFIQKTTILARKEISLPRNN